MDLDKKIFIVGNSRSGTTLVSRILGLNSAIYSFQELHFFEWVSGSKDFNKEISRNEALKILNRLIQIERSGFYQNKNTEAFLEESQRVLDECKVQNFKAVDIYSCFLNYWTVRKNKKIACEQTPRNLFYMQEIKKYFPRSKVVLMVRDPRSVLLSQKNKWKRKFLGEPEMPWRECVRSWVNYHPITLSKMWSSAARIALNCSHDEAFVRVIKYEDLTADPVNVVKKLCCFLEIDFEDGMMNVPRRGSSLLQDDQHISGVFSRGSADWKQSAEASALEVFWPQKIAENEMVLLNYSLEVSKPDFLPLIISLIYFPFHIFLSLLFNLHRNKNIIEAISKRFFRKNYAE